MICVLVSNFCLVTLQVILPVVLSEGQYLQFVCEMHLFLIMLGVMMLVREVLFFVSLEGNVSVS